MILSINYAQFSKFLLFNIYNCLKEVIPAALYVTFYLCWNKIQPIRKMAVKFLKTQNVVTF
jgi:hypothetical protein